MLPVYLERNHDQPLRNHLLNAARSEQTMFVLVRGTSCTGKTRTAFEAARACLPDWQLVYPKTPKGLLALLDADALAPRTVLWLNEAQNHLRGTDGEEAAATLHTRLENPGPLVVLGTLWPEYHRDLTATPQPGQDTKDAHPNARALLAQAVLVDVPASFTPESLKDPRVHRDPPLTAAARTSTGGRITQTLAAGPQLVDHYEQATEPHGPYGHAVISVAMDAYRLGHTSPLPVELLKAAARAYLTKQQIATANPDTWFTHALEYAREKVQAVAAALEPVAHPDGMGPLRDAYCLSDYLDHHARTTRRHTFPPESFWAAARDHAAGNTDLRQLASAAEWRGRLRIAADLYRRAADAGDTRALAELAGLRERAGDTASAEQLYQRAADAGNARALMGLAGLRERAGDTADAEQLYQRAADAGDSWALTKLARLRERAGDMAGAERFARRAADAGDTRALAELADRRERAGDTAGAEQLYQRAADAGDTHVLMKLARLRSWVGDTAGAEQLYQQAADAGDTRALAGLARRRQRAGDTESAELLYQEADARDTWDSTELAELADRRALAGDMAGAERLYQAAAEARDFQDLRELTELAELADRRERTGDTAGAEQLYQQAANAGAPFALMVLARRRERAGDTAGAKRLRQFGLEADGSPAQPW